MNRETIIQMARDAGFNFIDEFVYCGKASAPEPEIPALERFAKAIIAATKEEDAKICEELADNALATGGQTLALDLAADEIRDSK